ncbi:MAG: PKD domain-containing protein [Myxococcota bacterium]
MAILSPASGSIFRVGDEVQFTGSASDPETGDVSASLVWTSQKVGEIGTGASFSLSGLTKGKHVITATATDPDGNVGSAAISVRIRR